MQIATFVHASLRHNYKFTKINNAHVGKFTFLHETIAISQPN